MLKGVYVYLCEQCMCALCIYIMVVVHVHDVYTICVLRCSVCVHCVCQLCVRVGVCALCVCVVCVCVYVRTLYMYVSMYANYMCIVMVCAKSVYRMNGILKPDRAS